MTLRDGLFLFPVYAMSNNSYVVGLCFYYFCCYYAVDLSLIVLLVYLLPMYYYAIYDFLYVFKQATIGVETTPR